MGIPNVQDWKCLPGNWDPLHATKQFPSSNRYGLPDVCGPRAWVPDALLPWVLRNKLDAEQIAVGCWHYFFDDYRFESVWNKPERYDSLVLGAAGVLTPDFSMYLEWPMTLQLWNTYRSRWLGAYWSSLGANVVPTINWGDWRTFDFAFAGVMHGSTVCVSTVGVKAGGDVPRRFRDGYRAMVEVLTPSMVLVYGEVWKELGLAELAPFALYSPKGILEMRSRLENQAPDTRQLQLWDEAAGG